MAKRASNAPPADEGKPRSPAPRLFHRTDLGEVYLGDSLDVLRERIEPGSVDLIMTSPPFGLVRKKDYGNADAHEYLEWFKPFGEAFHKSLKPNGSLVIDIGGAWIPGQPTRSLYHYELLIMLCREFKFHLAQDFFWWNPAKLPSPAEWVNIRRIRVKDAINCVWWLSPTPWPKASNRRVLSPYSDAMRGLLKNGYKAKLRPSGHDISAKFSRDNGAAIPPNLISIAHTESNSSYIQFCRDNDLPVHPARFPAELPEYFIRMLTDPGDIVVDPFGGSCITGAVAERLRRRWVCCELREDYLKGAISRFGDVDAGERADNGEPRLFNTEPREEEFYKAFHPGNFWTDGIEPPLDAGGGAARPASMSGNGPPKPKAARAGKLNGSSESDAYARSKSGKSRSSRSPRA